MLPETTTLPVVDALCASLETMAFITPFPPDGNGPHPCPTDARRVSIAFTGPVSAVLELVAPAAFGAMLASNLMVCDPSDPDAHEHVDDALKELMNVTCGAIINSFGGEGFELGIPQIEALDTAAWDMLTRPGEAAVLEADGHLIAVRALVK
jgi:hypothetical protein